MAGSDRLVARVRGVGAKKLVIDRSDPGWSDFGRESLQFDGPDVRTVVRRQAGALDGDESLFSEADHRWFAKIL